MEENHISALQALWKLPELKALNQVNTRAYNLRLVRFLAYTGLGLVLWFGLDVWFHAYKGKRSKARKKTQPDVPETRPEMPAMQPESSAAPSGIGTAASYSFEVCGDEPGEPKDDMGETIVL